MGVGGVGGLGGRARAGTGRGGMILFDDGGNGRRRRDQQSAYGRVERSRAP